MDDDTFYLFIDVVGVFFRAKCLSCSLRPGICNVQSSYRQIYWLIGIKDRAGDSLHTGFRERALGLVAPFQNLPLDRDLFSVRRRRHRRQSAAAPILSFNAIKN